MFIFNSNSREICSKKNSLFLNKHEKWWAIDGCLKLSFVRNLCSVFTSNKQEKTPQGHGTMYADSSKRSGKIQNRGESGVINDLSSI